ncbi:HemK2/MTQ2 family protein methyltransferase [Rhodococcus sp. NPDC003318]|uniref:HemK2/MTQ2 family protein methyltransferase n=1 Tax=Rhodococcus sp. NPDC003318 TaxID=3364503 RepID=UPI00368E0391
MPLHAEEVPAGELPAETVPVSGLTPLGRIVRLPGVYRPQEDTHLLATALAGMSLGRRARVLDYCTGSGAVAVAAARCGAETVVAVDVSPRATVSAWLNAQLRRLPIRVRRGGLDVARRLGPYDVVLANPPYVPAAADRPPTGTRQHWNGGPDGRAVIGALCVHARHLLRPGGSLLLVQSAVADPDRTVTELRRAGLRARVAARTTIPFGPVMRDQSGFLLSRGLIEPGQDREDVVVIRGDRP